MDVPDAGAPDAVDDAVGAEETEDAIEDDSDDADDEQNRRLKEKVIED